MACSFNSSRIIEWGDLINSLYEKLKFLKKIHLFFENSLLFILRILPFEIIIFYILQRDGLGEILIDKWWKVSPRILTKIISNKIDLFQFIHHSKKPTIQRIFSPPSGFKRGHWRKNTRYFSLRTSMTPFKPWRSRENPPKRWFFRLTNKLK